MTVVDWIVGVLAVVLLLVVVLVIDDRRIRRRMDRPTVEVRIK